MAASSSCITQDTRPKGSPTHHNLGAEAGWGLTFLSAAQSGAYSATGTRAQVARVRAEYPDQLDYSGCGTHHIF